MLKLYNKIFYGHIKIIEILLLDKRIDNKGKDDNMTPSFYGHIKILFYYNILKSN